MTAPSQPARYPAWGTYFTRLTKSLDSQEVLDKLNISQTMVSRWAKGSARPQDIARAKEVATLLGGQPEEAEKAIRADTIKTVEKPAVASTTKSRKRTAAARRNGARRLNTPSQNVRSEGPLERIRASRDAFHMAEQELDAAVNAARDAGLGWPDIAAALG